MEPKEQTFDFTKDTLTENLVKWIIALAKIPLQHYWGETWKRTAEMLTGIPGFEKDLNWHTKQPVNDRAVFTETGFCMSEGGVYADNPEEGYTDDASDFFVLKVEPVELYSEEYSTDLIFVFRRNDKVCIEYVGEYQEPFQQRYAKFAERMELPDDFITWQEAYDLLCKIAKDEQSAVPECNV